jgi:hypothetical protein
MVTMVLLGLAWYMVVGLASRERRPRPNRQARAVYAYRPRR